MLRACRGVLSFHSQGGFMFQRLLFADDSLTMHRVVEITFAQEEITLVAAYSGAEALQLAAQEPLDGALVDMDLGDMDGYTLCQQLLAQQ
jgi:CheY-like chemotaxis protein